jgi:hypothetical protein
VHQVPHLDCLALGALQIWISSINRTHKGGVELQAGPDGAILKRGYSEFWMKNEPAHVLRLGGNRCFIGQ